jgi:amidohydrolase
VKGGLRKFNKSLKLNSEQIGQMKYRNICSCYNLQIGSLKMPLLEEALSLIDEVIAWRHHLHQNPELLFDVFETAAFVKSKLEEFGCDEVVSGLGRTGVVGVIYGKNKDCSVVGLRADMDALPILETTGVKHASKHEGKMHACGHDGHTAMLLGAAKILCTKRDFNGTVVVIFQPAEEGGGGGREMVEDGIMERFKIEKVFGLHNMPGLNVGEFGTRHGGIMAATNSFDIEIIGKGGHAAMPHETIDPIIVGAHLVTALQTIVSRTTDPLKSLVLSVTKFHAGETHNVIAQTAKLSGTFRTLNEDVRVLAQERIESMSHTIGSAFGATVKCNITKGYPVTFNHGQESDFTVEVARSVVGFDKVDGDYPAIMGGEDFSYMLQSRKGSFMFMGNGMSSGLHHSNYDFNDAALVYGVSYWVTLATKISELRDNSLTQ